MPMPNSSSATRLPAHGSAASFAPGRQSCGRCRVTQKPKRPCLEHLATCRTTCKFDSRCWPNEASKRPCSHVSSSVGRPYSFFRNNSGLSVEPINCNPSGTTRRTLSRSSLQSTQKLSRLSARGIEKITRQGKTHDLFAPVCLHPVTNCGALSKFVNRGFRAGHLHEPYEIGLSTAAAKSASVCCGSFATKPLGSTCRLMSASLQKRPNCCAAVK
jgi:hypothetical protein